MHNKISQLNDQQRDLARKIADDPSYLESKEFTQLNDAGQARVLEVAVSYVRYLVVKKKQRTPELRQRSLQLLSARSKIPLQDKLFSSVSSPEVRDDQGHQTHKLAFMYGEQNEERFAEIRGRIAYHDLVDLPAGYVKGAQIQMGDFHLRQQASDLQLQKFSVIDVFSISPRDEFQQPISWRVQTGWDRFITDNDDMFAHLDVGGGYSYLVGGSQFYGLLETRLKSGNGFDDDYQWSAGVHSGWLYQGEQVQLHLQGNWMPPIAGDESTYRDVSLDVGARLTSNLQIRLEAKRQLQSISSQTAGGSSVAAGLHWYF